MSYDLADHLADLTAYVFRNLTTEEHRPDYVSYLRQHAQPSLRTRSHWSRCATNSQASGQSGPSSRLRSVPHE